MNTLSAIINFLNSYRYFFLSLAVLILILFILFPHFKKIQNHFHKKPSKKMTHLKKRSRKKTQGIVFGRYRFGRLISSPTDAEGHIAVFGGPGLGKTTALLVSTLRTWQGTSLTVDISGDICKNIDKPNKMVFEPENPHSTPYNIFGAIDELEDEDEQNEVLEQLALQLLPDAAKSSSSDATEFFTSEGRKILTASFIAFYHKGFDFTKICEMVVDHDYESLFELIKKTQNPNAIRFITSFAGTNEKNTAGCKQAVDKVLKLFATNAKIKKTIRRPNENESSFTPKELEKHNVFIIIDDAKLKLYAPVLRIITSQCMEFFSMRENYKKPTILFALDEFASFGKMEITEALRKLRKKGVRIMTLTQSMADMDLIYGKDERMSMMNNFRFKVVFGADDTDTQDYFAKLIGHKQVTKHSKSISDHRVSTTESESKEWVIEPENLARLGNKLLLLHPDGYLFLKKNYYFK